MDAYSKFIKSFLAVVCASFFMASGICFELFAALGGDSITVVEEGLSKTLGVRVGTASLLFSVFVILLMYLFARRYLGWTTIANGLLLGNFINLVEPVLGPIFTSDVLFYRYLVLLASVILISIACVILICFKSGMNSFDGLAMAMADKTGFQYRYLRIAIDGIMILGGYLLGGTVGIGTIISMALTGPTIDFLNRMVDIIRNK